jgi:hypothetical protein
MLREAAGCREHSSRITDIRLTVTERHARMKIGLTGQQVAIGRVPVSAIGFRGQGIPEKLGRAKSSEVASRLANNQHVAECVQELIDAPSGKFGEWSDGVDARPVLGGKLTPFRFGEG